MIDDFIPRKNGLGETPTIFDGIASIASLFISAQQKKNQDARTQQQLNTELEIQRSKQAQAALMRNQTNPTDSGNTALYWGLGIGGVVLIGGTIAVIIFSKSKKTESEK